MKNKGYDTAPNSLLEQLERILDIGSNKDLDIETLLEHIVHYYETIIGCMPGNVYWLDKHGKTVGCNKNVLTMFGLDSIVQFKGLSFEDMGRIGHWTDTAIQSFKQDTLDVLHTGTPKLNIEEPPIPHHDGRIIYFLTHRVPLFDNKKNIIGVVGISIDITERKQLEIELREEKERAEAANNAKTEFLTNMRHDIRTPLSGIVGYSELLKSESTESRIKEYADNLISSSHALLNLMDEVLEAVRVSSGEIPMLKRKFNLRKTFDQVIALNQARAHEKKLNLSLTVDTNLPNFVIGDKIRIHRIALELIGNALNFTDSGYVSVDVTLAKKEERQLVIKLTVTDTGMGIPKDKQQEIYLQFKRLTPSYQGIYKGAGLGLYVVKQFVEELGGEIYVSSESRKGTRFTCLIPLQAPLLDDDSGIDEHEDLKAETAYMTPAKHQPYKDPSISVPHNKTAALILVVEDNYIAQTVAKALLTQLACAVDVASNGIDALELCKKKHYDLIFMDIGLGDGMDGYEVTQHIRNCSTEIKNTPIIALTAHGGDESRQRCIETRMDAVLTKPLTQANAIDILKSFIPERHETPEIESSKTRKDLPDKDDELFQLNQFPILNSDEALKNCTTQEKLKELLTLMTYELPKDLDGMKNAFKAHDYLLVEKIAHKIKGGAVYIGTTRMKFACQYLERYWKSGERKLFKQLYLQAISTIEETITYIEGWLQKNTS